MTGRVLVHLDAGRATVRRDRHVGRARVWSATTSQQPGEALEEVLTSISLLGHGRRADVDVVLETPRVVFLRPRSQPEPTIDRQRLAEDELREVGLRPSEVVVRWVRDDFSADEEWRGSLSPHELLVGVARDVVDDLERRLRQRRCAGRVGLDLGVLRRLRPILASNAPPRAGSVAIVVDVTLAAISTVVSIDGHVRSCRVVAVDDDASPAVTSMLRAALEDVPVGSRPSVGHPAARPLECIIIGADGTSPVASTCAEVLAGGGVPHDLRIRSEHVHARAQYRSLRAVH